jgi:hypothetical protein
MAKKGTRFTSLTDWMNHLKEAGAKGGKARAAKMTKKQLSESARKAVQARWKKAKAKRKEK